MSREAIELWRGLHGYLRLSARVTPQGSDEFINVNEVFNIYFTVTNNAPIQSVDYPRIRFREPMLEIRNGQHAELASGGSPQIIPFDDDLLEPGGRSTLAVQMRATSHISSWFGLHLETERVARAYAVAKLDFAEFFKIWTPLEVGAHIEPT